MSRYIVPAWLIVEADSPAEALRVADEELTYLCRWNERAPYYDLPETDATITPEDEVPDLDAPHLLPEDFAV